MPWHGTSLLSACPSGTCLLEIFCYGIDDCSKLAQPPFGNMNLGQLFFAVVHEHKRPPLQSMEEASSQYSPDERTMLEGYMVRLGSFMLARHASQSSSMCFLVFELKNSPTVDVQSL